MTTKPLTRISLRAAGVSLILDLDGGALPTVLHWGADPGLVTAADLDALARASLTPIAANEPDEPVRVGIVPEHWRGWMGRPGLSGSRAGRAWSPRFQTVDVRARTVDGAPVVTTTPTVDLADGGRVGIRAQDRESALELLLEVEMDPRGLVRMRAAVTNLGEDDYQVDEMQLSLPVPARASETLDFGGRWGNERAPQRHPIVVGAHRREARRGRTGADSAYVLHAGTPGFGFSSGEIWAMHVAWSGNHVHEVQRHNSGEQFLSGGELLLPGEIQLSAGDTYRSPWVYASYGEGLDRIARRFHDHLRARPDHPRSARPVTLNVWEAVYFDHDLPTLTELADRAAELGVERFVLDDGWFGSRRDDTSGLGDWVVSPEVWPDGLHPLVDHVRGRGMQFGLWFEPEMINPDSDLARAHPEWMMTAGSRHPVEFRHQQVLNLGIPECYAHIRDALFALLDEYRIDYIKWDHNRDLIDAGTASDGRPAVHAQTLAFYALVDDLRERYPELEIESCSSGGGRVDLGVLERTDRVWVSDNIDPLDRQRMNRWTAQLVPPEMMGTHIASGASHVTGRTHDLSFRAATAVFGHLGIEWDLRKASVSEIAQLRDWVTLHRRFRGLLHSGDVVRVDHPDDAVVATGVVSSDRTEALYSYAVVGTSDVVAPGRVRFPGLDPQLSYRVEPLLVEHLPPSTRPPAWWHGDRPGITLRGSLLREVGLAMPLLPPEHAVLLALRAGTDG
ncbi:alpha-galactosidase [Microbacterium sp. VKM Ac-2923]|uniref:alpha-galactosidase n=1 Tax=Microbacterium sp. VKM Ac-2923 TaxID=2929476 RepID=UPI001FB37EAB|nr:alpha-galactosidase [Microbacterium sp. VKM Ac-2923]MCJ1706094.1 alpha-galactosidase [Microbacterium sp. VKM Ac-2923]